MLIPAGLELTSRRWSTRKALAFIQILEYVHRIGGTADHVREVQL